MAAQPSSSKAMPQLPPIEHFARSIGPLAEEAKWRFVPRFNWIVDDRDTGSQMGEVYYNNPMFDIANAIRLRSYVFTLERLNNKGRLILISKGYRVPANPKEWQVCAFRGREHYNFGISILEEDAQKRSRLFTGLVLEKFFFPLFPDIFEELRARGGASQEISWKSEAIATEK